MIYLWMAIGSIFLVVSFAILLLGLWVQYAPMPPEVREESPTLMTRGPDD